MVTKDGGPAFPHSEQRGNHAPRLIAGMSLRDYFAAAALPGVIHATHLGSLNVHDWQEVYAQVVAHSYAIAEAMLAEREKA